jgi:ribosomal-protein-serine acetyltransferase
MVSSGAPPARPPARIVVGGLVLDRWRRADVESLLVAISTSVDHLRPWMPWASRHGRRSVAQFLAESEEGWERGDRFEYAIRDRSGNVIGSASLMGRIGPRGLEIGYWVHVAHTRRRIATHAAAALTEAALSLGSVDHVEIHHDEANLASRGVPAGLGFRNTGTFGEKPRAPAETGREVRWRIDEREFAASPAKSLLDAGRRVAVRHSNLHL